jgi:CTD small phosphatase-like protein 2
MTSNSTCNPSPRAPSEDMSSATPTRPPLGGGASYVVSSTAKTPISRTTPNNNYAAPHTPIASVKRPRGYNTATKETPGSNGSTVVVQQTVSSTPVINGLNNNAITFSPMHPPTSTRAQFQHRLAEDEAAAQQLDYQEKEIKTGGTFAMLFSPVLHFLGSATNSSSTNTTPTKIDFDADGDVLMGSATAISSSTTISSSILPRTPDTQLQRADEQIQLSECTSPSVETSTDTASEDEDEFNPYLFIKHLPPYQMLTGTYYSANKFFFKRPMQCLLPPKQKSDPPITLVLDLDETLVHCTVDVIPDADVCFPVLFGGMEYNVHVRLRPHLSGFLQRISRHFEVIVFTASQKVYANELLNRIDPEGQYIRHRLYRESCLAVEGNYLKDLNVLTGSTRSLEQMALVDNSPHAFGYQIDNGIPIESWFDDRSDTELLKLEAFLMTLLGCDDVRPLIREKFQTFRLVQEA